MSLQSIVYLVITVCLTTSLHFTQARRHHLVLDGDIRKYLPISTFGYTIGGTLQVKVDHLGLQPMNEEQASNQLGFSLVCTDSNNLSPLLEGRYIQHTCFLQEDINFFNDRIGIVYFKFDFKNNKVHLQCNDRLRQLTLLANSKLTKRQVSDEKQEDSDKQQQQQQQQSVTAPAQTLVDNHKTVGHDQNAKKSEDKPAPPPQQLAEPEKPERPAVVKLKNPCSIDSFDLVKKQDGSYSFEFEMIVANEEHSGLYGLYMHNCLNYPSEPGRMGTLHAVELDMRLVEKNLGNYLSAGEIPLPQLFFALSIIFFLMAVVWYYSLKGRADETFNIHYLMGVLVFVKALALMFHGINYYFIARDGEQVETWAILYYVTHFLKGALLFVTIVLIGTGWAFIKHILSDKDKKIFMIVIPMQVVANIADIITQESEEGALIHIVWREIFILVDLICCGAILFPVIWSIRHLQEASNTDGKAAINLRKLKLFRHFYIMIVCYIYFTRIIVYLLRMIVPFRYEWVYALFEQASTFIFFVFTGYYFQPKSSNPYHQLLQEEIELDEEVLFIQPNTFSEARKRNRDLESSTSDVQLLISGGRGGRAAHDHD